MPAWGFQSQAGIFQVTSFLFCFYCLSVSILPNVNQVGHEN